MAKQNNANYDVVIEKQLNNQSLEVYKLNSCRSKISISISDLIKSAADGSLTSILSDTIKISNFLIKDTIQTLLDTIKIKPILIQYLSYIEKLTFYTINNNSNKYLYIVANEVSSLDDFVIDQLNSILSPLCFYSEDEANLLLIDETLFINMDIEQTKSIHQLISIKRHLNSFYQTDEQQREKIHSIVSNEFINCMLNYSDTNFIDKIKKNAVFFGGEMYIYGKIFDNYLNKKIYITDTESLYEDAIYNDPCPNNSTYNLVSYKVKDFLLDIVKQSNIHILLSNISKTGLGESICNQIMQIKPNYLILITCNHKVTLRDINILNIYKLNKIIKISTTYDVFISVLELI